MHTLALQTMLLRRVCYISASTITCVVIYINIITIVTICHDILCSVYGIIFYINIQGLYTISIYSHAVLAITVYSSLPYVVMSNIINI